MVNILFITSTEDGSIDGYFFNSNSTPDSDKNFTIINELLEMDDKEQGQYAPIIFDYFKQKSKDSTIDFLKDYKDFWELEDRLKKIDDMNLNVGKWTSKNWLQSIGLNHRYHNLQISLFVSWM